MASVIAIDPGLSGAIAHLDPDNDYAFVWDMPVVAKGKSGKRHVNPHGLLDILRDRSPDYCAIEEVSAMPGQGVTGVFSLGDSFGVARACLASTGVPIYYVRPQVWKKHFNLGRDKEQARALAINLYPNTAILLRRKLDADRAEALLIGRWMIETKLNCR